jgi:hypothetical protein
VTPSGVGVGVMRAKRAAAAHVALAVGVAADRRRVDGDVVAVVRAHLPKRRLKAGQEQAEAHPRVGVGEQAFLEP